MDVNLAIERDDAYDRDYIPVGAGWEIQTKGRGSTFRLSDASGDRRLAIPDSPYLHKTLTEMAREVNNYVAALQARAESAERERDGLRRSEAQAMDAYEATCFERDKWKARAMSLEGAGKRVTDAFRALGVADQTINSLTARRECEQAMTALDTALAQGGGGEGA